MALSRIEQAARNSAIWCDTVCRAHGAPGEFYDVLWLDRHPAPRFYPNVVTLSDQQSVTAQRAHIHDLMATGLPDGWGVKDSFCALDLAPSGFQPLFEAAWLWRAPSQTIAKSTADGIHWTSVRSAPDLARWEATWSVDAAFQLPPVQTRLFLPSLLADQEIVFIAAYKNDQIVGGAIAKHTDGVVGLSNVFGPVDDAMSFWAGCVATAQTSFPGVPLVGYARLPDLVVAQAVGFEMLQALRVWIRSGSC